MKKICLGLLIIIVTLSGCTKSSAGYKYESARLQYNEKKYDKALEYIDQAVKSSDKQEYLILKGQILHKLGRYDEAIEAFNKVPREGKGKKVLENNKQAYKYLALVYMDMEKYDEVYSYLEKAQGIDALHEIDEELLLYQLDAGYNKKDYKNVIDRASKFISKYKDSSNISQAYIDMARCYGALKDNDNAGKYYDKAIELKDYSAYYYKADVLEELGDYKGAYDCYEEYIKYSDSSLKYEIYAKQIDCLIKMYDRTNDASTMKLLEDKINVAMSSDKEEYIRIFGKKYIGVLERKGKYDDAYVYAQEYLSKYPDDEAIKNEILFLETRIVG